MLNYRNAIWNKHNNNNKKNLGSVSLLKTLPAIDVVMLTHQPTLTSTSLPFDYVVGDWDCAVIAVSVKR